jgi:hypothetical protein
MKVEDMLQEFIHEYDGSDKEFLYSVMNEIKELRKQVNILRSDLMHAKPIIDNANHG